ncbi:MAG: DUF3488 domain-containing protein [Planctomycetota bacterium]|nr:MAG: DUF3488 domain-containing protein [Planctomycetota bacterium]
MASIAIPAENTNLDEAFPERTTRIERFLQIAVAVLAALATTMLGIGAQNPWLPVLAVLASIVSLWWTDIGGKLYLGRTLVNVAMLAALAVVVWQVFTFQGTLQVFSAANLLVYLQVILQFRRKTLKTYRYLVALSLFQVVSAAAFVQGAVFGLFLLLYLGTGIATLLLLQMHETELRFVHEYCRGAGELSEGNGKRPPTRTFGAPPAGDAAEVRLGWPLWRRMLGLGFGTVLLTLAMFFIIPRIGGEPWRGHQTRPASMVGFSPTVRLGELGEIIEDPQPIMRVKLIRTDTKKTFRAVSPLYLRGAVLTQYYRGLWAHHGPGGRRYRRLQSGPTGPDAEKPYTIQQITIEPSERPELFAVWPCFNIREDQRVYYDAMRQRLFRPRDLTNQRFAYELGTTAFRGQDLDVLTPSTELFNIWVHMQLPQDPTRYGLRRLRELAAQWAEESEIPPDDHYRLAIYFTSRFRDSNEFTYTLNPPERDPTLDPIEDFLFVHRQGHCEYFATALALMLRSRGIPARVVVGYKTDEFNRFGQYYQVRQLHAHAWVEIYLGPNKIPAYLLAGGDDARDRFLRGGWLRLDPTPFARDEQIAKRNIFVRMGSALNWLDYLWVHYIADLDQGRQEQTIYRPLAETVTKQVKSAFDREWWARFRDGWIHYASQNRGRLMFMGSAALIVAALLITLWRALRNKYRVLLWLYRKFGFRPKRWADADRIAIEFYRNLERLLARYGMKRPVNQTPRRFIEVVGGQLAAETGESDLTPGIVRIVETYYQVRYGAHPLSIEQAAEIDRALSRLEHVLKSNVGRRFKRLRRTLGRTGQRLVRGGK